VRVVFAVIGIEHRKRLCGLIPFLLKFGVEPCLFRCHQELIVGSGDGDAELVTDASPEIVQFP